jgi:hypothetical protein
MYYVYMELPPKFTLLHYIVSYIEVPQDIVGAGAYNTNKVGPSLIWNLIERLKMACFVGFP